ncbi:hypothetical protein [Rhodococcus sp. 14-2483-1-2]|uniref:hypothetical protein n=1 Tax=Rhodococcus sp. 14-2483-1-2 TaxID=2023147 RepID=UPI0011403FF4|nr:hypothetical protein [Rhodococcus sp. 14-2483-1-2]
MMELSAAERTQLSSAMGCVESDLDAQLGKVSKASEEEYVRMMLGQRVFTRGSDIRVFRLFLLVRHVYEGAIPSPGQVSAVFQTTTSESRSLLRAVRAKYQYELFEAINSSLRVVVGSSVESADGDGSRTFQCESEDLIEALNERVARHDGSLSRVSKVPGSAAAYSMRKSTYSKLVNEILI